MSQQRAFITPEGQWPNDKGANSVLSFLFWTLLNEWPELRGRTKLHLASDNCAGMMQSPVLRTRHSLSLPSAATTIAGQNKNKYVMWFASLLVAIGLFEEVKISFMVAGHTVSFPIHSPPFPHPRPLPSPPFPQRCYCDACFGLIKRKLRKGNVYTPRTFVDEVVNKCCKGDYIKAVVPSQLTFYDWKAFLPSLFTKPVQGISKFHVFRFSKDAPGKVFCKLYSHSSVETERTIAPLQTVFPSKAELLVLLQEFKLSPEPISAERLLYLKENVIPKDVRVEDFLATL